MQINLREAWFPWAGYAGEVYALYEVDSLYNVALKLEPGSEDINPIQMVLGGTNEFSIASAENLLVANSKGANLVAIGVLNYKSPTCFIALENRHIQSLKDFEGKRVGVLTGSETETIYRILIAKNHIRKDTITEVEAPYDLSSFINTNTYDIRPAFIYDETVSLDLKGIKYNIIKPEDYNVKLMGAVYFTTREMIEKHPQKVQAFVNIIAKGWEKALENPQKAIHYLKRFDKNIDTTRELASLEKGLDYFRGQDNKALFVSSDEWKNLFDNLVEFKRFGTNFDFAKFDYTKSFDNSFILKYHNESK